MRRRRPRASWVLLGLSVVLGASTTLVLRGHLARLEARAAAGGPGVPVVLAVTALPRGAVLASGSLRLAEVPERYLPPGALRSLDEAQGRTLGAEVLAGEVLTRARLAPAGGPVAALVPPGLRAVIVTVAVPPGSLAPGDRVDLLATFATGAPHTETVVSEAEVLGVTATASHDGSAGASVVTLLVSPETAERIAFARAFADLSIAVAPAEGAT